MIYKNCCLGLALFFISLAVNAVELAIPLLSGKPSQQEFELAAKRALFTRNYEIWTIDPGVVVGKYKDSVEIAIVLTDSAVILRDVNNGGHSAPTITRYLVNLRHNLTYELAMYTLVPVSSSEAGTAQGLIDSAGVTGTVKSIPAIDYEVAGNYQSKVTVNGRYAFKRAEHRNLIITLEQDGNKVKGYNKMANLELEGTITGDEIRFRTFSSDVSTYELKGIWKISRDGRRMTGKWWFDHGDGEWDLTRF